MGGRGAIQQLLIDGKAVEPGDRAQPPRHRGPGPAVGLQFPGEALDVRTAGIEQADMMLLAPAGVLAQVQRVSLARQTFLPLLWVIAGSGARSVAEGLDVGASGLGPR
jgi:hypothetical protein